MPNINAVGVGTVTAVHTMNLFHIAGILFLVGAIPVNITTAGTENSQKKKQTSGSSVDAKSGAVADVRNERDYQGNGKRD